jgi:hypothetical protein
VCENGTERRISRPLKIYSSLSPPRSGLLTDSALARAIPLIVNMHDVELARRFAYRPLGITASRASTKPGNRGARFGYQYRAVAADRALRVENVTFVRRRIL